MRRYSLIATIISILAMFTLAIPAFAGGGERRETGDGGELRFEPGATVLGAFLEFDNNGGTITNCVVINSERGGRVISGVINPFPEEIAAMQLCFPGTTESTTSSSANASNLYLSTGIGATLTFTVEVPQDWVLLVGGYVVDGLGGGSYVAHSGPATITTTVTDGFVQRVHRDQAQQVFCGFVQGARSRGYAVGLVQGLPEWSSC